MKRIDEPRDAFWTRKLSAVLLLVVVIVSALGFVLDRFLIKEGIPRVDLLLLTNAITGLVAGALFYQFARNEKRQQAVVQERMRTIAELNHHIRNALQVIKFCGSSQTILNSMQLQLINESANRIEWALKEILPKYPWAPSNKALDSAIHDSTSQNVPVIRGEDSSAANA
ncbi:MAG TPA: hypothetical protein VHA33_16305 [Candidatus Angelobacter sp.]|jgi:uncharacterized protein with HEPN domain|nr:hypothetical protein [Candidatus Angelobacter sp.]